jgi:hypothetical protein
MICKTLVLLEITDSGKSRSLSRHRVLNNYSFAICLSDETLYGLHENSQAYCSVLMGINGYCRSPVSFLKQLASSLQITIVCITKLNFIVLSVDQEP